MSYNERTVWPAAEAAADRDKTGAGSSMYRDAYTTGWLVAVKGPERGRDYRLRFGRNAIGRDYHQDILIFEDPEITRKAHAYVIYDDKSNRFFLAPGMGTLTYFGTGEEGRFVDEAVPLSDGDHFCLGNTELVFVAFCSRERNWKDEQ